MNPANPFKYIDDELYCESLPVSEIARQAGTPLYLYSKNALLANFSAVKSALGDLDAVVCYALKANSNETLLALLASAGAGADVVSGGELYLALKNGFPAEKIVYAGVGKSDEEIRYALEQNIWSFNVESVEELALIDEVAGSLGKTARVGLRLNPDVDIHGHPYIATGKHENKFGIDLETARETVRRMDSLQNIRIIGLHSHIGSQVRDPAPYLRTVDFLQAFSEEIEAAGGKLDYLDIGGGFGLDYENPLAENRPAPADLVKAIAPALRGLRRKIVIEPGRSLVAETGILVTKALFNKETRGKRFVVVDAGMNDLIRPSLYQAYHAILPLRQGKGKQVTVDVVGPICESSDFLGLDRRLPALARGDLLAVMTAGAYGFSLSCNYNARPRPAEALVDGASFEIIRPRGRLENLWS